LVDDEPANLELLIEALEQEYHVSVAINGERALKLAINTQQPDLILLDIIMPNMDGYEVCRRLKADPRTARIPVIFITAKSAEQDEQLGLDLGAVDYITKPFSLPIVRTRVHTQLALYNQQQELERLVQLRTKELFHSRLEAIQLLGKAVEFKDHGTGLHIVRMSHYSKIIASAFTRDEIWSGRIFHAAAMHDVGKIGIPDCILTKPSQLDENEWEIMKKHSEFGARILSGHSSDILQMASEIALHHHEKWDGTGYPQGLAETAIPLSGRIVAIADVFDALSSHRPYKEVWTEEQVANYITEQAGKQFDPALVTVFLQQWSSIQSIRQQYTEEANNS
jgi:putative two-component system response regulator